MDDTLSEAKTICDCYILKAYEDNFTSFFGCASHRGVVLANQTTQATERED